MQPKTLTTHEAIAYIQQHTGKTGKPYHRSQIKRWRGYGWIDVHIQGALGEQNRYLVADLDALIERIKDSARYKQKP